MMQQIQVQVRIRNKPTWKTDNLKNRSNKTQEIVECVDILNANTIQISHSEAKKASKEFSFDTIFSSNDSQEIIYKSGAQSLIDKCLQGYNGCIFVYGQTASGKTYTMQGLPLKTDRGIMFRSIDQIVTHIQAVSKSSTVSGLGEKIKTEFTVKATYLEIYQENLKDLLSEKNSNAELKIRMDPESVSGRDLFVEGLQERIVVNFNDYINLLETGAKNRTVAETNMNEVSSRSHAVLTLTIEQVQIYEKSQTVGSRKRSKIHFIDLAGSERADSTGATGVRLKEGSYINQSLLSLGNVISALSSHSNGHIPYRDSKLTYLLSDSLGGNSLTLMIACVSPMSNCFEESMSTLRFAERAKKVKNCATINIDPASQKIMELEAEILRLKKLLAQYQMRSCWGCFGFLKKPKNMDAAPSETVKTTEAPSSNAPRSRKSSELPGESSGNPSRSRKASVVPEESDD